MLKIIKTDVIYRTPKRDFVTNRFDHPELVRLRVLANDLLSAYGLNDASPDSLKMAALRDAVSRAVVHPVAALHGDASIANMSMLPSGKTWADYNSIMNAGATASNRRTAAYGKLSPVQQINKLFGTPAADGSRADDGLLRRLGAGQYQIRDLATYAPDFCTGQAWLLSALGLSVRVASRMWRTNGHDTCIWLETSTGRWIYEDATYNERSQIDAIGQPADALELLNLSIAGQQKRISSLKTANPSYDANQWVPHVAGTDSSYWNSIGNHPFGQDNGGSETIRDVLQVPGAYKQYYTQIPTPRLASVPEFGTLARQARSVTFTRPGVALSVAQDPSGLGGTVRLRSTWWGRLPHKFQRRVNGGAWFDVQAQDWIGAGAGRVEYRVVDADGGTGCMAEVRS